MKFETQDRYDACAQHVFSGPDEDPNATPPTSTPADNDSYLVEDPVTGEVKALWKYDASESVWKEIKTGSGACDNIRTSAGGTTGDNTDHSIVATSPGTVVLPAPVLRRRFSVRNASTGNVTVTGNIDGVAGASILLGVGQGISFHAVAATWYRSEDLQASPYVFVAYSDLTYALPGGFVNDVNRYNQVLVSQCRGGAQNLWDPGPGRFRPNRPGMYRVVASYNVFRGTTIEAGLTVRKNGVGQQFVSNFGAASSQITADVEMNGTTDYIDVANFAGGASTRTQNYSLSQLRIEWIRP